MLANKRFWPLSWYKAKKSDVSIGPYRDKAEVPKEKKMEPELLFEEKIIKARMRIPGPIRRISAIVLFVPVMAVSFVFAVVLAPLCWIATGSFTVFWDFGEDQYSHHRSLCRNPLLRGTTALFFDKSELYRRIRRNY